MKLIDLDTISDTVNRPADLIFGLFSYRLRVNQPGETAILKIYFSGEIFSSDSVFKYDTINGWYDYSEHTTFNDDGQSVTLEVKDGGYGDSDGLANGVILWIRAELPLSEGAHTRLLAQIVVLAVAVLLLPPLLVQNLRNMCGCYDDFATFILCPL